MSHSRHRMIDVCKRKQPATGEIVQATFFENQEFQVTIF